MPQFKFNTISRTDIESSLGGSHMITAIDYDGPNHLLITGCPGSGKTTVSIMRAERLVNLNKQILLITYQDLLKNSLINISSEELGQSIVKFYKWYANKFSYLNFKDNEDKMIEDMKKWEIIDEIIIDEGQDFECRIYRALIEKCKKITVGADNAQKLHEKGLTSVEIQNEIQKKELLPKYICNITIVTLSRFIISLAIFCLITRGLIMI